jgi:hypothetical protein
MILLLSSCYPRERERETEREREREREREVLVAILYRESLDALVLRENEFGNDTL